MIRKTMMLAAGAALLLSGCNKQAVIPDKKDEAASDSKWLETTAKTAEGGMLMGNPNAKVKLLEYGALSCSHCAQFSRESTAPLKALIAKGNVSYEFRNYLLNVMDLPAAILARCGGPGPFFTITEQLFAKQPEWLGKASSITKSDQAQWANFPPELLATVLAEKLNLDTFVKERGISIAKSKACLSDKAAIKELGDMSKAATVQYKVQGTPTFFINGQVVPSVGTWDMLEPELKKAGA